MIPRATLPVPVVLDLPAGSSYTEAVRTLALMSRFVIADISEPGSIAHELQAIVPDLRSVAIQPITAKGERADRMFEDLLSGP